MRIRSLHLKNFRRFTDLEITAIPSETRLVLLIGSNGSGKTCVFDGFEVMNSKSRSQGFVAQPYAKVKDDDVHVSLTLENGQELNSKGPPVPPKNSFYGRTSFRQVPRLTRTTLGQTRQPLNIPMDSDRPRMYIDRDERFENDIERIAGDILRDFFRANRPHEELRGLYIDPLNRAFENIFGTTNGTRLELTELIPPLDGQTARIMFRKGTSEFHYDQLSAGEKEVVNILFNLLARKEFFTDSIYFFDEIDLHLNTKLQCNLLKEITENWVPENCQLWTASHSLGFIQYANEYQHGVVIDFDDLDFDQPQVLSPRPKDDLEIFQVAVTKAFIDQMVQGRRIIFSENQNTPVYNDLALPGTLFFVAMDKNDAFHKARNLHQEALLDRDYLTTEEVEQVRGIYPFIHLLPYYSIENLLYHPDNLTEHAAKHGRAFDREAYVVELTRVKNENRDYISAGIVQARSGYPFFKENEHHQRLRRFRDNSRAVIDMLRSDVFEEFYQVFPAKDHGGALAARQNLSKTELSGTDWFKAKIERALA